MQARTLGMQAFRKIAVWSFGETGTGNGQFDNPRDIATDTSNNIYVTDFNNQRVQVFSSAGVYSSQWAMPLHGSDTASRPNHIAIDANNNVFVGKAGGIAATGRIYKFNTSGTELAYSDEHDCDGIAVDGTYVYYLANPPVGGGEDLITFDTALNEIDSWSVPDLSEGVEVDSNGDLLIGARITSNGGFRRYSTGGTLLETVSVPEVNGANVLGITQDTAGNVWITANVVHRFNANHDWAESIDEYIGTTVATPYGIHYDGGRLYIADSGNDRVVVVESGVPQAF